MRGSGAIVRCISLLLVCSGPLLAQEGVAPEAGDLSPQELPNPDAKESKSRLSDEVIPLQIDSMPPRPNLLMEWGEPFLGNGEIRQGLELPTGAVWNPSLLLFGNFRSAVQYSDSRPPRSSDWSNRLDVFTQLSLTPTERLLIGLRPIDDGRQFLGYRDKPDFNDGWNEELDANLEVLFFEGDFGELFPRLDLDDSGRWDLGFSVGRQPLRIQDGILIDDVLDSVGVVKNNIIFPGIMNWRATCLIAWEDVHRDNNLEDDRANLFGLFNEIDLSTGTLNLDLAYVSSSKRIGDGLNLGLSGVGTLGSVTATWRLNASVALDAETAAVGSGALPSIELSWTPTAREDVAYCNLFWAIDDFTSAARGPSLGGALARTGILFEAVGLGGYGAPLSNRTSKVVGGAVGYQWILQEGRRQLILECGARVDTQGRDDSGGAIGLRYQQALGQHWILQPEVFGTLFDGGEDGFGARVELQLKF